jgi:branched-chain amino acid transport system permease protein
MSTLLPALRRRQEPVAAAAVLAVGGFLVWYYGVSPYYSRILAVVGLSIVVAAGLNLLTGVAGQLSLGQAGFFAVGSYTTALLTVEAGWSPWLGFLLGPALCALLGLLLAWPALRVKGPYLAMVTIAFGLIVHNVAVDFPELTNGPAGLFPVPLPSLGGTPLTLTGLNALILVLVAATVYTTSSLIRSRWGRAQRAVHGNDLAAATVGVPVVRMKRLAFVLSAVYAGIAGAVFAPANGFVNPDPYTLDLSLLFLIMVILGGAGTVWGPVVGAVALTLVDRSLSGLAEYRLMIYGGVLLLALHLAPEGLVGGLRRLAGRVRRGAPPRPEAAPPAWLLERTEPPLGDAPLLRVEAVTRQFAGLTAVEDVTFEVWPGTIHAVVGPNGAGKTTLLNLISGVDRPTSGQVHLDGHVVAERALHEVSELGVARTFQNLALFADSSALENVLIGLHTQAEVSLAAALARTPRVYREEDALRATAMGLLEYVGLADCWHVRAGDLPQGHQRLLEVARALAARPRLLLLDEPAAGLNATEVETLGRLVERVRDSGVTVVVIEHHMDLVMRISDRVTVLDRGRLLAEGTPAQVQADQDVIDAYLGPDAVPLEPVPVPVPAAAPAEESADAAR